MPRVLASLALILCTSACSNEYQAWEPPPLDFSDRIPIELAVASRRIERAPELEAAQGPVDAKEHGLAAPLDVIVAQLLYRRLEAIGGEDYLRVVIEDASVHEQALTTTKGVRGYFTTEPESRLEGRIAVRLERINAQGDVLTSAATRAKRSATLPEGLSFVEHQERAHEMLMTLVDDVDRGIRANLEDNFKPLLAGAPPS